MAHSENYISKVKLPGSDIEYEIHDAQAIHSAAELGLSAAMVFKGTKATYVDLPSTGNKAGDVWHVTADDYEYVWNGTAWEELGAPHDFVGTEEYENHIHSTVTITGTNAASEVAGSVTIPTIATNAMYTKVTASQPNVSTNDVLGANTTFKGTVTPSATGLAAERKTSVSIGANGTTSVITEFDELLTNNAISELNTTTIKAPTSVALGSAANWTASVDDGVLSFDWTTNVPTAIITKDTTVATGAKSTISAITDLGTPATATVLTGVQVTQQPEFSLVAAVDADADIHVLTGISKVTITTDSVESINAVTSVAAPSVTLAAGTSSTGFLTGHSVTTGTTSAEVTGTAAAQTWTQKSGFTGRPSVPQG